MGEMRSRDTVVDVLLVGAIGTEISPEILPVAITSSLARRPQGRPDSTAVSQS